ncbi:hypothetical protein DL96DRAFT_1595991, partial [Flagelloscypha sp. PMI_526]
NAQALSLVSKEVQCWLVASCAHFSTHTRLIFQPHTSCRTDPHLFKIVHGCGNGRGTRYWTSLVDQICSPDASPRLILARHYVRAVTWKTGVKATSDLQRALDHFPNLVQFCLWGTAFPFQSWSYPSPNEYFEVTKVYPSMRRIATCTFDISNLPPNAFESPFWMSITHLQVNHYDPISSSESPFQLPLFITMSSLTHLALTFGDANSEPDADLAFSRVRGTFPPSLILCLVALTAPQDIDPGSWITEMVHASLRVDERIVIWSEVPEGNVEEMVISTVRDTFYVWCGVQDGVQTFWELGESVLRRRREMLRAV